jgi:hypothetical protein
VWFTVRGMQAAPRPLFDTPALLLLTEERRLALVAPGDKAPRQWVWAAFSGATPTLRQLARELADHPAVVRSDRPLAGFVGLQTVSFYFLLDEDEDGAYVTAYAAMLPLGFTQRQVHIELAQAAAWLRGLDPDQLFPAKAHA